MTTKSMTSSGLPDFATMAWAKWVYLHISFSGGISQFGCKRERVRTDQQGWNHFPRKCGWFSGLYTCSSWVVYWLVAESGLKVRATPKMQPGHTASYGASGFPDKRLLSHLYLQSDRGILTCPEMPLLPLDATTMLPARQANIAQECPRDARITSFPFGPSEPQSGHHQKKQEKAKISEKERS